MNSQKTSRRGFLLGSVGASFVTISAKSYARILGANDRLGVGYIGAGGMGIDHLNAHNKFAEPNNLSAVAVADCWAKRAEQGKQLIGASQAIQDYRELLELKEIDYVTIATPEHRHAPMILDALNAGKHVYCEKPLTHTIGEAIEVRETVKATGLALQVGVQGMSDDSYASAGVAIRKGVLGRVVQAQIDYVRRYGKQGFERKPNLRDDLPQPTDLNWKMWLGSAPEVPWNPHHYYEWRNYSAYSGGIATDLITHRLARIMKACDLMFPRRVTGMGGIWHWPDGRDLPDNFEMLCEYSRGMTVHVLGTMSNRVGNEHCIRGYRGTLYFTPGGWIAKDKDNKTLAEHKKNGAEDIVLHHANLHHHLRNGESLNCPVDFGAALVAATTMANESWRSGRMLAWDSNLQDMVAADTKPLNPFPDDTTP